MRDGCCLHQLCGQTCFREVRCTFSAQRIDAVFFHLQMKQKPIGLTGITESLQGGDIGASQGHTVFGEVEHLSMPFEYLERLRECTEHRVLLRFSRQSDRRHADFQCLARTYRGTQRFSHELTAKTYANDRPVSYTHL